MHLASIELSRRLLDCSPWPKHGIVLFQRQGLLSCSQL